MRRALAVGALVAAVALAGCGGSNEPGRPASGSQPGGSTTNPAATAPQKATITLAEFEKIQEGMSCDQAFAIVGGKGELVSSSKVGDVSVQMYQWPGEGGLGANANITCQNGKVVAKAQLGLR